MADTATSRTPLIVRSDGGIDEALGRIWEGRPGLLGWFATVDHKEIGKRYLVTAFAFLIIGGLEALAMRLQLAQPNLTVLDAPTYNRMFTMHGLTMIFLYALPILSGISNYIWPLLLGSRDMAFPRLNAFSYWVFLFSGLFIYMGVPMGAVPDGGWFNYVPNSSSQYSAGLGIDIFALGMVFLGISTTVGAINFIVTLFRTRAPGMSVNRLPIIVWGTLSASIGNVFAVPAVSLAFLLLWLDRRFGTHFYDPAQGGSALLWQHLFWLFGHPWVYAIVLPGMGIVSEALPVFCRRPLVGYTAVALSTVLTMVISFSVWVHHMFATGLPLIATSFFGAASMVVVIPSAVAVFAWIATIWTGRPVFKTPFLYFAGFVMLFVIGGVSGFMTGVVPFDWQLTDTYFIVAHLHYVLLGINVFPVIGGIYYWFPKMTGRLMDERLGKWNFWIMFIGFNLAFFPMHITGLLGMPRRVYTYAGGYGWDGWNLLSSAGSLLLGVGILLFVINVVRSRAHGKVAGNNPWDAGTLEWSTTSPPPPYNFAVIPSVATRLPLWESRLNEGTGQSSLNEGLRLDHGRETTGVSALDAEPDVILKMPGDSCTPLVLTLAITAFFIGLLFLSKATMLISVAAMLAATLLWLWPERKLAQIEPDKA